MGRDFVAHESRFVRDRPKPVSGRVDGLRPHCWRSPASSAGAGMRHPGYRISPLESHPERVWGWADLQIERTMRGKWHGAELAPLRWQMLTDPQAAPLRFVAE